MSDQGTVNHHNQVIDISKGRRPMALPVIKMTTDETTNDEVPEADHQAELFSPRLKWIED